MCAIYREDSYLPPKKPYSFTALLGDILVFAADALVDGGRLCLWMPVAYDDDEAGSSRDEFAIPTHPRLRLLSCCVQDFRKCEWCCLCSGPMDLDSHDMGSG